LHLELGSALHKTGDFDEAREHVEASLALMPPGPSQLRMQALRELGVSAFFIDDLEGAVTHTQAALAISEALHDQFARATLLSNLGIWRFEQGNWAEGVAAFEAARQTCEMIGGEKLLSDIELNLGIAHGDAGESGKSRAHLLRSLDLAQKTGNELVALRANSVLARGYLKAGAIDAAYDYAQTALESAEAQGNELLRMMVLAVLAEINLKAGQLTSARSQIEGALASAEMLGMADSVEAGVYLHQLGRVQIASGAFEEACVTLDRSLALVAGEDPLAEAEVKATFGELLLEMGQTTRARAMLAEAATTFEQIGADEQLRVVRDLLQHEPGEVSYEQT
jgi:tetratricopeptide (TPR) repeat protein